jgi:broad-specificity NMP kinase
MALLRIEDEILIRRLQEWADRENKSIEAIIAELLDHASQSRAEVLEVVEGDAAEADRAFQALAGLFDVEIPPELLSVREAIADYYRKHDESTD